MRRELRKCTDLWRSTGREMQTLSVDRGRWTQAGSKCGIRSHALNSHMATFVRASIALLSLTLLREEGKPQIGDTSCTGWQEES